MNTVNTPTTAPAQNSSQLLQRTNSFLQELALQFILQYLNSRIKNFNKKYNLSLSKIIIDLKNNHFSMQQFSLSILDIVLQNSRASFFFQHIYMIPTILKNEKALTVYA